MSNTNSLYKMIVVGIVVVIIIFAFKGIINNKFNTTEEAITETAEEELFPYYEYDENGNAIIDEEDRIDAFSMQNAYHANEIIEYINNAKEELEDESKLDESYNAGEDAIRNIMGE